VSVVQVIELAAMTRQAYAAMWRFLIDIDGHFRIGYEGTTRCAQPWSTTCGRDWSARCQPAFALGRSSVVSLGVVESGAAGWGLDRDGANGQVARAKDSPRVVLQPAGAGDGVVVEG
jgi:hypothetical protein